MTTLPRIICIEGIDGVGKSTVCEHLVGLFTQAGNAVLVVSSPSRDKPVGPFIRSTILPDTADDFDPALVGKLFEAAILENALDLVFEPDGITPRSYNEGDVIILDRWFFTMLTYQQTMGVDVLTNSALSPDEGGLWASVSHLFDRIPEEWRSLFLRPETYFLENLNTDAVAERLRSLPGRRDKVETSGPDVLAEYQVAYRYVFGWWANLTAPDDFKWFPVDTDQDAVDIALSIFLCIKHDG